MGMFDKLEQLKNADFTANSQAFMLYGGTFEGMTEHPEFGKNFQATVTAGPEDGTAEDAQKFVLYGVMAEQVGRMDSGDLPAKVIITQDGRANVLKRQVGRMDSGDLPGREG